jgi:hypothetical protein
MLEPCSIMSSLKHVPQKERTPEERRRAWNDSQIKHRARQAILTEIRAAASFIGFTVVERDGQFFFNPLYARVNGEVVRIFKNADGLYQGDYRDCSAVGITPDHVRERLVIEFGGEEHWA